MSRLPTCLAAAAALLGLASSAPLSSTNSSSTTANIHWLGSTPKHNYGTTFGLPWARGAHNPDDTVFSIDGDVPLQSWPTAYWPDGSIKWTAHAISGSDAILEEYTVTASGSGLGGNSTTKRRSKRTTSLDVQDSDDQVVINTGKISAIFPKEGNVIVKELKTSSGKIVGRDGKLVLNTQSAVSADVEDRSSSPIDYFNFQSGIDNVTVSEDNDVRALVTVRGSHQVSGEGDHADWLPFILQIGRAHV